MDSALIDSTSETFLGQWKRLVSTTNWEKGEIIHGWREALVEAGAPLAEYSDEAWSRRVGNVTPQHVGRLRRVFERFGEVRGGYQGLFWSHFQAALDWDDAELWLEGAVQSDWSISEMRHKRWETRGAVAEEEPRADESAEAPWDDDGEAADASGEVTTGTMGTALSPHGQSDDDAYEDDGSDAREDDDDDGERSERASSSYSSSAAAEVEPVRPFAALPPLPADVNDAFEAYKLCILRHKMSGWDEISRDDMLASLESLKQLALAPAEV